jgi:P27 family predicted phage terminase small subunit
MSGPQPTPTPLLEARGSWRAKERKKDGEPQIEPLHHVPECPEWLEGFGREHWDRHIQALAVSRVVTAVDVDMFAALCLQYGRWRDAEEKLRDVESRLQITESGYEQVAGWTTEANKRFGLYKEMAKEFGMTPAARAKLRVEPQKEGKIVGKSRFFK